MLVLDAHASRPRLSFSFLSLFTFSSRASPRVSCPPSSAPRQQGGRRPPLSFPLIFPLPHLSGERRPGVIGRSAGGERPSRSLRSIQGRRPAGPPVSFCGVMGGRGGSPGRGEDNRHLLPHRSTAVAGVEVSAPAEQGRDGRWLLEDRGPEWSSKVHTIPGTRQSRELGSGRSRKASKTQSFL